MKIERTKNATRNIIWGVIEKIITILLPFITRTILIKVLGAEYLGLNSLFTSILQVLSISELGISSAIVFSMYKPIAEDNNDLICAFLNLYRKVYMVIGTIILVAGLAILPFLSKLIAGENNANVNIYILYLVYLANTVLSYYLFAYKQALFTAYQRNDLISKRTTIVSLFSSIFQIILLLLFKNYYIYVIVVPLATITTNVLNAWLANKMFPGLQCKGKVPDDELKGIKKRIIGLLSFKIYGVVYTSVDTIVISSFLGLIPLAIYNNYFYVQTAIIGFLTIITTSITAGVGNKMITNSREENYNDFMNFTFANGWISSWCAVCLVTLYQHFMKTWVGEDLTFSFETMILVVLYFYLSRVTTLTFTYREAAGLWWEDRIRPLVATITNLGLNLFLVNFIGMNGILLSTVICTVFINVPWGTMILFKKYFERSPKEYFCRILLYIGVSSIISVLNLIICAFLPDYGWHYLIIKALICLIVPNILFYLAFKRLKEYKYTKYLINKILSKVLKHDSKGGQI